MSQQEAKPLDIHTELKELTASIQEMVKSFRQLQSPIEESRMRVPEATSQLERITQQTEEATHRVLDMVEEITNDAADMVQDLKVLRKALPATYFKNRSKVRDTFERLQLKAERGQDRAFAIMDALQFQDITSQQMDHAAHLLDEVESKLHSVMGLFNPESGGKSDYVLVHKKRVFDPNANFNVSPDAQTDVDNLVSSLKNGDDESD